MALVVKDRVKEVTTTTGTSNLTLGGAVYGFQSFSVIGNGNTTYYGIYDSATGDWEVGVGTYSTTGPTLTRDTVLESSNSGSKVVFGAGTKDVFVTYPAERSVYLDAAGSAVTVLDIGTLGVSTANISTANITAGTISTTPTSSNDLVNKTYVDAIAAQGISYHTPVKYEVPDTTGNLNATYNNGTGGVGATLTNAGTQAPFAPDGPTAQVGDRILIYNQTNAAQNGVYQVTVVGTASTNWVLTRTSDTNTYGVKDPNALGAGDAFYVTSGNTGAGETYVCNTAGTITFGTTAITFVQISSAQVYSAGAGLTLSNLVFSITPVGTANTYGSSSSVPVFTTNAYGQVTSVTNTGIAISAGAVSGLAPSATTDTTNASNITSGTLGSARLTGSYTGITGVGTLTAGTWNANTIGAAYGGTGITSYTVGDILYADGSTSLAKLADVVAGNALLSGGVGTAPAWGKIGLQTHVSGTLQVVNGGTGATTLTGYVYGNGTGAFTASTSIPNSATTATSANTASAIVARDGSGNFSAGTITASLNGNASTATSATSATTATNQSGGTVNATTGSFSGVITSTISSGTAINIAGQSDSFGYNTTAGQGTYIKGTGSTYIYGGGTFYDGSVVRTLLTSGNYNSYAPTLTGTGASGTWSINITGSAGSSTTSTYATYISNIGLGSGSVNVNYAASAVLRTESGSGAALAYAPVLHIAAGDTMWQAQGTYGSSGDGTLYFRQGYNGSWGNWLTMLSSYNYNNYAPTLTGTGASGTWSINITGSAGSAGSVDYNNLTNKTGGTGTYTTSGDYRAPIFYDSNNTSYYLDPASTSELNKVYYNSNMVSRNYGIGQVGLYSPYRYQAVFSMGESYLLPADGTATGNLYGIAWSHPYAGGAASNLASHGMLILENGGFYGAWGGGRLVTVADIRGTVFYDYNDTGYYIDPASTSDTALRMRGGALFGPNQTWGAYLYVGTNGNISGTATVATTNGNLHLDPASGSSTYLNYYAGSNVYFGNGASGGVYAQIANDGSFRSPIYYDYSNTGYYLDGNTTNAWRIGTPSGYLDIGPMNSSFCHFQTDRANFYFAQQAQFDNNVIDYSGNWALYDGYGIHNSSWRAPIFYDSNNTGYYVDPASGSYLYSLSLSGNAYFQPNSWIQLNSSYGLYWPNNNGAHFEANTLSTYTQLAMRGSRNGYGGIYDQATGVNGIMYDGGGNGGVYREANGRWYFYYHLGNDCMGIGTSSTSSTYSLYLTKGVYAQSRIDATIFYDTNNTGYYVDPASSSQFSLIYADNWFRAQGETGLYSSSYGQHIYAKSGGAYWGVTAAGNGNGGLIFYQSYESSLRGYVYWDGSGFGLLHSSGGWAVRTTPSVVELYNSVYAPIIYDSNNSGYYVDPNSNSRLNQVLADGGTFYGATYFQSNQNTTGSSPPLQAYSNNGSGAIMAFHRGGYYAVNMGLDSDNVIRIGGWSAAANRLQMDMSGNLTMAGSVTAFSDERLKKDWADLSDDFIERLASVKAGTYTRIDSGERQAGSSAQDWQELLPEVVSEDAAGTLALAYGNAAVVACVELAKSVVALRAEIKALRAQ